MAEAFLNETAGDIFEASSAGLDPGKLNPLAVTSMSNIGIDISAHKTKSVLEFFKMGEHFDYVITVCDEASGERCPIFPGVCKRIHWPIQDPSALKGSYKDKLNKTRNIRDSIEKKVLEFIKSVIGRDSSFADRRNNPEQAGVKEGSTAGI